MFTRPPSKNRRLLPIRLFRAALWLLLLSLLVWKLWAGNFGHAGLCLITLGLTSVPTLCSLLLPVSVPAVLEVIIMLFAVSANILGEMLECYLRFPFWDKCLHILWGFLSAAIGYSLLDILGKGQLRSGRIPTALAVFFVLSFSAFSGVVWEFFERFMDTVFHTDMQKDTWLNVISSVSLNAERSNKALQVAVESVILNGKALPGYLDPGLTDTMRDLFLNFLGSCIFGAFVIADCRSGGSLRFLRCFMPRLRSRAAQGDRHEN